MRQTSRGAVGVTVTRILSLWNASPRVDNIKKNTGMLTPRWFFVLFDSYSLLFSAGFVLLALETYMSSSLNILLPSTPTLRQYRNKSSSLMPKMNLRSEKTPYNSLTDRAVQLPLTHQNLHLFDATESVETEPTDMESMPSSLDPEFRYHLIQKGIHFGYQHVKQPEDFKDLKDKLNESINNEMEKEHARDFIDRQGLSMNEEEFKVQFITNILTHPLRKLSD